MLPQPLLARELVAGVAPEELADALEHHDVAWGPPDWADETALEHSRRTLGNRRV